MAAWCGTTGGNVRELRNTMERLLLLAPSEEVRLSDLPVEIGGGAPRWKICTAVSRWPRGGSRSTATREEAPAEEKGDVEARAAGRHLGRGAERARRLGRDQDARDRLRAVNIRAPEIANAAALSMAVSSERIPSRAARGHRAFPSRRATAP